MSVVNIKNSMIINYDSKWAIYDRRALRRLATGVIIKLLLALEITRVSHGYSLSFM